MKVDYLKECMSDPALNATGNIPIDLFNKSYCIVCANRECARSALNNTSFDVRALSWKEKLFTKVPRAEESDQNYNRIRDKKFISINGLSKNTPYEIQSYEPIQTDIISDEQPINEDSNKIQEPESESEPKLELEEPKPLVQEQSTQLEINQEFYNTPFNQGTILKDNSKEKILEPGSSYTFDDE